MELTYTDREFEDVGILDVVGGDFAFGIDENDFDISLSPTSGIPEKGALVYSEGGDVGGIVRGYSSDYGSGVLHVTGATWTGLINSRVIRPSGDYLTVSGTLRQCLSQLVFNLGLGGIVTVAADTVGVNVEHTFMGRRDEMGEDTGRYMGGWTAMWQLLTDNGLKARISWDAASRRLVLRGMRRTDWTDAESIDAGLARVSVTEEDPVNHLVALGQGDLAERTVLDVYMDSFGNVSTTQTLFGIDEIVDTYDNSSAGDPDALFRAAAKKLGDLWSASQSVRIGVEDESVAFELGDLVGGTDAMTGVTAKAIVSKKIVSISGDFAAVEYESTVRS